MPNKLFMILLAVWAILGMLSCADATITGGAADGDTDTDTDTDTDSDTDTDTDTDSDSDLCEGVDCTYLDEQCNYGACNPETGLCEALPDVGAECDDTDPCTSDDQCSETGTCEGTEVSPPSNDACDAPESVPTSEGLHTFTGNNTCATDTQEGSCGGTGGAEFVYSLTLAAPQHVRIETVEPTGDAYDTAIYVRTACDDDGTEIACNDNTTGDLSFWESDLSPGTYYIFVDGISDLAVGDFELEVEISAAATSTIVDFPSEVSLKCFVGDTCSALGTGGGGVFYQYGEYLEETFAGTGQTSISQLDVDFTMDNLTSGCAAGSTLTWDVLVNGVIIGAYSLPGGTGAGLMSVSESYTFASVPGAGTGDQYTLRYSSTHTVCSGGSSWNWFSGGTATLID